MKEQEQGMTLIVKTITRMTVGLIMLFGLYIVAHGHLSPGGGFAGGVIIALSFIHIMIAFGKDAAFRSISQKAASFFESLGAIMFITLAILGVTGGYFFLNFIAKGKPFDLFSAGIIPLANIAIAFKVACGLFIIVLIMGMFKISKGEEGK